MTSIGNGALTLGDRMARRQKELHLNDASISELMGVSKVAVGKWRRNETEPTSTNLESLAKVLETTTDYLLYGDRRGLESLGDVGIPFFESIDISQRADISVVHLKVSEKMVTINRELAVKSGADIESCFGYMIDDGGMGDRISSNSLCVADSSKKEVKDGKIYCFRHGVIRRTRYLFRLPNGGLLIKSHNAQIYPDEVIDPEKLDDIEIYGWVWQWSINESW